MIKLDEKFRIEPDTNSGWRLITKATKTRKDKKTKEEVEYESEDVWYLPTLPMILHKYNEESAKSVGSVEELLQHLKKVNEAVERVAKIYVVDGELKQL